MAAGLSFDQRACRILTGTRACQDDCELGAACTQPRILPIPVHTDGRRIMVLTRYSLDQFVSDMQELVNTQPDQQKLFDRGSTYLEKLVTTPGAIPEEYCVPSGKGRRPNHGSYAI